jgi:hypothetical protein
VPFRPRAPGRAASFADVRAPALIVPVVLLSLTAAACAGSGGGSGDDVGNSGPAPAGVSSEVWQPDAGFVAAPAYPAAGLAKATWSMSGHTTFTGGDFVSQQRPDSAGRFAGVTRSDTLTGYDTATGREVWHTPLPDLQGTATADGATEFSVETAGLQLFAVDRKLEPLPGDQDPVQVDVFDAGTGRFLWTRVGDSVSVEDALDAGHVLVDMSYSPSGGTDDVDAQTGKVVWHNGDLGACHPYSGALLCLGGPDDDPERIDPATGQVLWTVANPMSVPDEVYAYTGVVGDTVFLGQGKSGTLTAVDLATGAVRWHVDTGLGEIDQVLPLDTGHVVVTGLTAGSLGSVTDADALDLATGAKQNFIIGSGANGQDSTNGGVDAVRLGGTTYFVADDPDGTLHVVDPAGQEVTQAEGACAADESSKFGNTDWVLGDTVACQHGDELVLLSVPDLRRRAVIPLTGTVNGVTRLHDAYFAAVDDDLQGLGR